MNSLLSVNQDVENNVELQERLIKACSYYSEKVRNLYDSFFEQFVLETDNKAVNKSIKDAIERLDEEFSYKMGCLNAVKDGFTVSSYLEARAKASIEKAPVKKSAKKGKETEKVESKSRSIHTAEEVNISDILRPELYKILKNWRNEKAVQLRHPVYLIVPQKTLIEMSNTLPQTMSQLKTVKGIGEKKVQQFGKEMLSIIIDFCREEQEKTY